MKLVCYSLGKVAPSVRTALHKKLYGYVDFSNSCKYKYEREGLIQKLNCKKIMDSIILTEPKNAKQLVDLLKKHKASIYMFNIKGKMKTI